ncbi:CDP-glycerol glycerophosphotransferase family protein [Microbacterium betulae]|uniref:CDP-glycerol glycerophosphotransferase family protein n=1 Tax=Microbacterium betulae TaxID=2981139 RepID=A0AA97I8A6_9MICO|nr:CDP-glycerol glycerophosphotransferase family protein [Microbacterium sp. AB]WOF24467.1 CDP-glycerol glycerophosphotransferase family protein [Microbacterium sp. AB]
MASFSFGAGNAAKLLRLPLYGLGRLVTLIVPRTDRWVFGCGAGVGDGPLEIWRIASSEGRDTVWLAADEAEAREAEALGIPALPKFSWRGFWATARGGVLVVSYGAGDVNPYAVSGGFLAQLWHGIPLKRIGLDSAETVRSALLPDSAAVSRLLAWLYRGAQRRISLIPAASHLVRGRLESAFGLPDGRVVVTGEPRVDVLSRGGEDDRRTRGREIVRSVVGDAPDGAALVLYAPTWRDGDVDPAVPDAAGWREIVDALDRVNAVLLVRSHRLGEGSYTPPFATERVRDLGAHRLRDVTAALPGLDALVTDYSSLAYDAGLVPLPVLYLAPDVDAYRSRRGFYGSYRDVAGDDHATGWTELIAQLVALREDAAIREDRTARSARLSGRMHAFRDGGNARRVYDAIIARRGAGRSPRRGRR